MATAAEKWLSEQEQLRAWAAEQAVLQRRWFAQRDEVELRNWPVIVEYTFRHVVWVESGSQQRAVERLSDQPYEFTDDQETLCESGWKVTAPNEWDWDDVYEGDYFGAYQGLECNAHVETRRQWLRALDQAHQRATAENEDRDGIPADQRLTCSLCRTWREDGHETKFSHQFEVRSAERRAQEAVA